MSDIKCDTCTYTSNKNTHFIGKYDSISGLTDGSPPTRTICLKCQGFDNEMLGMVGFNIANVQL